MGTPVLETDTKGDIVYIALTDINGNTILRDERNDSTLQNKLYTGHKYDNVTGLTYAHARYLDTRTHTFTSVDPLYYQLSSAQLYNPQLMNAYSYANNNPVSNTDPTGLWSISGVVSSVKSFVSSAISSTKSAINNAVYSIANSGAANKIANTVTAISSSKAGAVVLGIAAGVMNFGPSIVNGFVSIANMVTGSNMQGLTTFNASNMGIASQNTGLFNVVSGGTTLATNIVSIFAGNVGAAGAGSVGEISALTNTTRSTVNAYEGIGATKVVGEDALKLMGGESQVPAKTDYGIRVIDQLVDGIANESKVGYTSLTKFVKTQIKKDSFLLQNDDNIIGVTWNFFRSPITGRIGASKNLLKSLEDAGINYILH